MKRLVIAGALGLSAAGAVFAAAATAPERQEISAPLTPEQQNDWDCLDAAVQDWGVRPTSAGPISGEARAALRAYYLGRLSAELGEERLVRWLRDARLHDPRAVAWGKGTLAACQARMERSAAALKPMEAKDFSLQRASSSPR